MAQNNTDTCQNAKCDILPAEWLGQMREVQKRGQTKGPHFPGTISYGFKRRREVEKC